MLNRVSDLIRQAWYKLVSSKHSYRCPICNYSGPFKDKALRGNRSATRLDSKCLGCGSNERHRLLHLVIDNLSRQEDLSQKSLLHIAPEECLSEQLKTIFGRYETADLFKEGVDHKEDLQKMSFSDASYDCIFISRVLTEPPSLDLCLNEIRRVLKPDGFAIIAETFTEEKTIEHGSVKNQRARVIGIDLLDELRQRFSTLELLKSDSFPNEYQLTNRIQMNGDAFDKYPDEVKVEGVGFMDVVVVCHP